MSIWYCQAANIVCQHFAPDVMGKMSHTLVLLIFLDHRFQCKRSYFIPHPTDLTVRIHPINASLVSQKVTPRPKLLHACDRAFFGAFCRRCFVGFGVALPICGRIRPTSSPWVGSLRVGQLWPKVGGALAGAAEQQQVHFLEEKGRQVCDHSTEMRKATGSQKTYNSKSN